MTNKERQRFYEDESNWEIKQDYGDICIRDMRFNQMTFRRIDAREAIRDWRNYEENVWSKEWRTVSTFMVTDRGLEQVSKTLALTYMKDGDRG